LHRADTFADAQAMIACFVLSIYSSAIAAASETTQSLPEDMNSVLEIQLAPPLHPAPLVSEDIGDAEHARETLQEVSMAQVRRAYKAELSSARARIRELVERFVLDCRNISVRNSSKGSGARWRQFMSILRAGFLAFPGRATSVRVHVHSVAPIGLATVQRVHAIGQHRARAERELFRQAKKDLSGITSALLAELENRLRATLNVYGDVAKSELRPSGFLAIAQLPQQAPVRVVASDMPYPTVASLVQDMESRWDLSEELVRAQLLTLQLSCAQVENAMVAEALHRATQQFTQGRL